MPQQHELRTKTHSIITITEYIDHEPMVKLHPRPGFYQHSGIDVSLTISEVQELVQALLEAVEFASQVYPIIS